MFFRMLRLIVARTNASPFAFRNCEQHSIPLRNDASDDMQSERQERAFAWFLVQPKNLAAGRLVFYPEIPVVSSNCE
jgi:hypothetical protein